jgi:very-short-patch-repair endonuclease/predicted transcriptional regulator of viral defense system
MPQRPSPTSSGETDIPAVLRPESRSHHPTDLEIERFARRRHGVLTVAELARLGLSGRAVRDRAAKGRLHRIHNGIYAATPPTEKGRWVAALLACGPRAVLSHTSAAALWDLARDTATVHVTLPGAARATRPGVTVHGARLDPSEIVSRNDIPCTTVARTLLDLAATQSHRRVELAIDRAEELRVFDLNGLRALLERRRGQRGSAVLSKVLDAYDGPDRARSPAERRLLALVRRARLPSPKVNAWISLSDGDGYRPDLLWEDQRLIVEVDGRTHHARRLAFEHDRRRDRRLALAGYETRRYAAREIQHEPDHVLAELRAFLSQPRRHP